MDFVNDYFNAERAESLLFIAVGLLAIGVSVAALATRRAPEAFYRGLAVPLVAVALIQLVVGTTVWLRSPQDAARVQAALRTDRAHIAQVERPRMEVVMRNFVVYRGIEIVLLLAGLAMLAFGARGGAWHGAGLGLALQAGLMLALDYFAEARGEQYLRLLAGL